MKIAVRYFSRGGNTKKLADAIANAVGVDAEATSVPLTRMLTFYFSEALFTPMAWTALSKSLSTGSA